MPRFLNSTLYSQYRLLKILNQVSIGAPKQVKLVDTEPLQTPRAIMSAQKKRAQIRDKIDQEQKAKEERLAREEEMRLFKQKEAFSKLKKAADPTLPGQHELDELKVSVGETPSDDLREWYKHLKKAQQKHQKVSGSQLKRPTSASSGIVRPDSRLEEKPQDKLSSRSTPHVPTLALQEDSLATGNTTAESESSQMETGDPLVTRPRSGDVCQVDDSETKVGLLHENTVVHKPEHEVEDAEESDTNAAEETPRVVSTPTSQPVSDQVNRTESQGQSETKEAPKKKRPELFFQGTEDFDKFSEFIKNTVGQQMFELWLALDRCNFAGSREELKQSLNEVKHRFCSISSPEVLPNTFRSCNNLRHITSFTKSQVRQLQNKAIGPLVTYWVPKYLSEKKQKFTQVLTTNQFYSNHSNLMKTEQHLSYPEPKTPVALPLRPRTCLPKVDLSVDFSNPLGIMEIPEKKKSRAKSAAVNNQKPDVESERTKSAQPTKRDLASSGIGTSAGSLVDDLDIYDDQSDVIDGLSDSEYESGFDTGSARDPSAGTMRPTTAKRVSKSRYSAKREKSAKAEDDKAETESVESYGSSVRNFGKFIGSAKMETLLQTLKSEFNNSGGVFKRFLQNSGNALWINLLSFWNDLQQYHALYYKEIIDAGDILRKAKAIFALYIVLTAPQSIDCSSKVLQSISNRIPHPSEDIFDEAEEYSIHKLCEPWLKMLEFEDSQYKKVEQYSVKRPLQIDPEFLKYLNSQGVVKVKLELDEPEPEVDEEREREEFYKKLEFEIPEEFRTWNYDEILKNRIEFEFFRKFIAENYGTTDLSCWVDVEGFKRMSHEDELIRDTKAAEIKSKYMTRKYFFGPNSPATTKEQEMVLALAGGWGKQIVPERPPNVMITEVGRYTRDRLERKWLSMFLATPSFAVRQVNKVKSEDSMEDLVMQKKRKQLQLSKIMESKWVSSSKEVIQFRRALLNPVTSDHFKKYLKIVTRENFLENDVVFWQEVQKFKDLFHQHADDSLAQSKVQMVVACFLESIIHPPVQIDIPQEQVQDILDKRRKPTAYMFREAQLTVFRVLYPHWTEFCKFRHKMKSTTKIDSTLDRKSARMKLRQKKAAQKLMDASGGTDSKEAADGVTFQASNLMDDIIMSQGDNVTSWKYSSYIEALKKQHQFLLDETSSRASDLSENSSVIGPMFPANQVPQK